jgi:chorismate mutase
VRRRCISGFLLWLDTTPTLPLKEDARYNPQTMNEPELDANIQGLRAQLDEVDREIVLMLNRRVRLVHELATIKGEAGIPLYDPKREEEILRRIAEENPGPIYDSTVREIFELIMHRIRDLEASH